MRKIEAHTLRNISSFAVFLLPATALFVKSGYSYGAAVLLLASLFFIHRWCSYRQLRQTIVIALIFLALAILWYELSAFETGIRRWDRPVKYIAGIFCLMYAMVFPPKREAFYWGLLVGCAGAGLMGIWQVYGLGLYRANGYSNAIQWGNIALLMATMLAIQVCIFWQGMSGLHRAGAVVCILLGLEASLLSASRGGWIALLAVIPVMAFFVFRYRRNAFKKFCVILMLASAVLAIANTNMLSDRWKLMEREVSAYFDASEVNTSLGIRFEQYLSALEMIKEKPLLGWGMRGYLDEMHKRVDAGRYDHSIREFNFIHHEFIDLWVKTGFVGMFIQAFAYIYVFALFWPTARRMKALEGKPALWKSEFAVRLCGITLVLMYFVFGQSVQFFVMNSGIIFFVFPVIILWSTLAGLNDQQAVAD